MWCIWMNADEAETGFLGWLGDRGDVITSCSDQTTSPRQQSDIAAMSLPPVEPNCLTKATI